MSKNPIIVPPHVGIGRAVGSSIVPCDKIDIDITKVEWIASYPRVLQKNKLIQPPSLGNTNTTAVDPDKFYYTGCSDKPAVYFIRSSSATAHKKIKLKITLQTKSACGSTLPLSATGKNAKLIIAFGQNRFTSNYFILPEKGKEVTITIEGDLDHIAWLKSPSFSLQYENNGTISTKNNIISSEMILEAFVLYDEPVSFYPQGVWVEALRFLFKKTGINDDQNIIISAGKITHYCHSKHGMVYDTKKAKNYFFKSDYWFFQFPKQAGGEFCLRDYLSKNSNIVNCYDQAGAVQSLCGALGIKTEWIFINPCGYTNTTDLIGIGQCNSPFYSEIANGKKIANKLFTRTNGEQRTKFDNHAFIRLQKSKNILDATIGPHTGSESLLQYAQCIMDVKANLEFNNLLTEIYSDQLSPKSLLPKLLTQSPLTSEAIEKACKGEYEYYKHDHGYPCKGVTDVIW